jgi:hypothetical protein
MHSQTVHYGLPAAGIILLSLHRQQNLDDDFPQAAVLQNLSVLVAEVEVGNVVKPEEPNYALLLQAIETIKSFLRTLHHDQRQDRMTSHTNLPWSEQFSTTTFPWDQDAWSFEDGDIAFWQSLAVPSALS